MVGQHPVCSRPVSTQDSQQAEAVRLGGDEADLFNGDVYYDEEHVAVLMVMKDQMFAVHQPERVRFTDESIPWTFGVEKNLIYEQVLSGDPRIVTLNDDPNEIPDGTVVRVYRTGVTGYSVKVKFGTSGTERTIAQGKMGEYVFMGGQWRSVVHDIAYVD